MSESLSSKPADYTLREYRRRSQKPDRTWLVVVAVLIHLAFLNHQAPSYSSPGSASWSAVRMADTDLAVARQVGDWPAWVRWFAGVDTVEVTLDSLDAGFAELDEKGLLDAEGREFAGQFKRLAAGELLEKTEGQWREIMRGDSWSWERIAVERHYGAERPEWLQEHLAAYQGYEVEKAYVAALGGAIWWGVCLVGLPFLPAALGCFRRKNHRPLSQATRVWKAGPVTVRFVLLNMLLVPFMWALYMQLPDVLWNHAYELVSLFVDILFRTFVPLLLAAFLLVRWRHGGRLLGLTSRPVLQLVLGMMSLDVLFHVVLHYAVGQFFPGEMLEGLNVSDEGIYGLVMTLVSAVILAPIFEEIVFRGFLLPAYERKFGFAFAALLSTFFFVFIHFYGVHGSLSVAFFGLCACALYRATSSLWTAIIFHALGNGLISITMWPLYHGF